ncbi:hypothetical protein [Mucilaginibacter rubeus]|uniref:hypothetical protein n=1 Tax=Mucilaginibacter rubeus TaxID=2027860 RepID=UPI00166DAD57|nr:hypothetical protein [Mucilaginibacter rubeus]
MLRRIRSNRDPRDTLYSELRREFGTYFQAGEVAVKRLSVAYPKFLFSCMIVLIILSFLLSFTLFRHSSEKKVHQPVTRGVQQGFDRITGIATSIRQALELRRVVDSLSAKKQLTPTDSVLLDSTLDRLSRLKQSLK